MNVKNDEIIIGINKFKAFLLTFFITGLFLICVWALTKIISMDSGFNKTFLMTGVSILTFFFGLFTISSFKKLIENNQGLVINNQGIEIKIGPNSGQFIKWTEIKKIKIHNQVHGNIYLLFFIENPKVILEKSKGLNRLLLKMNNVSHKTPVSITSTWLELNLIEIFEIIEEKMHKTVPNSGS